ISLTLTPMMCAKFMRPNPEAGRGRLFRASEWFFDQILNVYRHSLRWVLRHQAITLAVTILTMILSVRLYIYCPKGFFPQQDTGRLGGSVQGEQDISFPAMRDKMLRLTDIVLSDPAIDTVGSFAGGGGPGGGGSNTGRMFIMLKPLNERKI